jgi:hypothetical protein
MIPGTMSDYDLVYGTQALTKDTQLLELLQKDNPQITLVASPFRVWQREFYSWLSETRRRSQEIVKGSLVLPRIIDDLLPQFANALDLKNAERLLWKASDAIALQWKIGGRYLRLIIANPGSTPKPEKQRDYLIEYLPEQQVTPSTAIRFKVDVVSLPIFDIYMDKFPIVPQIPTYIFFQEENVYAKIDNDAPYYPS